MTPTAKLRFVEREVAGEVAFDVRLVRILQQWWVVRVAQGNGVIVEHGEWRNVPLMEERDIPLEEEK